MCVCVCVCGIVSVDVCFSIVKSSSTHPLPHCRVPPHNGGLHPRMGPDLGPSQYCRLGQTHTWRDGDVCTSRHESGRAKLILVGGSCACMCYSGY